MPLGLANVQGKVDAADEEEGRRLRAAEKLRRELEAKQSHQFYEDMQRRLEAAGPLPGMPQIPQGPQFTGSDAAPVIKPAENDPRRGYSPLGPSPQLTRRDVQGDPIPANAAPGQGGPEEQSLLDRIKAERAKRAQQQPAAAPVEPPAKPSLTREQIAAERSRRAPPRTQPAPTAQNPADDAWTLRFLAPEDRGRVANSLADHQRDADIRAGVKPKPKYSELSGVISRKGDVIPIAPENDIPDPARAFMANAYNSATFGQGDKLKGLAAAVMGGDYDQTVQDTRDWIAKTREYEPGWSVAGDMAGFVAPGGLIAKGVSAGTRGLVMGAQRMSPTLGFLAKTGQAATLGGAVGGAYGGTVGADTEAMQQGLPSPELFSPERGQAAQDYATMGAAIGAVSPAAGVVLRPVGNAIGGVAARVMEPFKPGAIAAHNSRMGADAARRSLERAGILTLDDLMTRAANYGDKPVVTGELGQDPLNSLVALVRTKGTTGDKAMAVLEDRVHGMPGRMLRDIADETGMNPQEVLGSIEDMVKASRERAAPLYDVSENTPFAETPELERIARAPAIQHVLKSARGRIENQAVPAVASRYGGDLGSDMKNVGAMSGRSAMPPLKHWDEVKQLLDEEITRRRANQIGIEDVQAIRDALVRELDTISAEGADYLARGAGNPAQLTAPRASPYAKAREAGGDAPRIRAGVRSGERALSGAQSVEAIAREVAQLSGSQLTAYQMGVIRNMATVVENGNLSPKRINSLAFRQKLEEIFGKPAADGLVRKFGVEAELTTKGARWNPNVGAVTSQAQLGMPSAAADAAVNLGASALRGDKFSAGLQLFNMLRRRGYSENQRNALGDILLSSPEDAGKALFPGQAPNPGAVPPPIPPAGRVRQNPPGGTPSPGQANAVQLAPLIRDAAGGVVGATAGAVTTPEGEDPVARALMWGGAGALGTRIGANWAEGVPLNRAQTNAFIPPPSRGVPWMRSMQKAGFDNNEVMLAQRFMQGRFAGQSVDDIAQKLGVPADSLAGRITDIQQRLDDAGIGIELQAGRVADDLKPSRVKPADRAPPVSADKMTPKDLIIGYNDGDSTLNIGLDLDLPEASNMGSVVKSALHRVRVQAKAAKDAGNLKSLADEWGVTTGEIEKFVAGRPKPNAGGYQQSVERIVSLMEKAEKLGNPMRPVDVAQRLGMSQGSVAAMLSQARNGAKPLPAELVDRVKALKIARGRPIELASHSPPELGGAVLGAGIGGFMDDEGFSLDNEFNLGQAVIGGLGGAVGGHLAKRATIDKTSLGSFGANAAGKAGDAARMLPNLVEDASDEALQKIQLDMIGRGEVPPLFKTFRMPDGRIIAWNGDEARGGIGHAEARDILGLGNTRLEHGQSYLGGPPLSKTNWYDVSGDGPAPRSLEQMVRTGTRQGRSLGDIIREATPDEQTRDLRQIGAVGPARNLGDYSKRRALGSQDISPTTVGPMEAVKWRAPNGVDAEMAFGFGDEPTVNFYLGKALKKGDPQLLPSGEKARALTDAETKATFDKAFSVMEREVIKRGKDAYHFRGATPEHDRFYDFALKRYGAPQGYVALVDAPHSIFSIMRKDVYDALVRERRIDPADFTIIPSKRGDKAVPEWRRDTGQFALPVGAAGVAGAAGYSGRADEPAPG